MNERVCPSCGRSFPLTHWRKRHWGRVCNACYKRLNRATGDWVENDREASRRWKRQHQQATS